MYVYFRGEKKSHVLVNQKTEYPIYWYFRGENVSYTCNSEDRISLILVSQRREYPIYWYFRQNSPYACISEERTEYPLYL